MKEWTVWLQVQGAFSAIPGLYKADVLPAVHDEIDVQTERGSTPALVIGVNEGPQKLAEITARQIA